MFSSSNLPYCIVKVTVLCSILWSLPADAQDLRSGNAYHCPPGMSSVGEADEACIYDDSSVAVGFDLSKDYLGKCVDGKLYCKAACYCEWDPLNAPPQCPQGGEPIATYYLPGKKYSVVGAIINFNACPTFRKSGTYTDYIDVGEACNPVHKPSVQCEFELMTFQGKPANPGAAGSVLSACPEICGTRPSGGTQVKVLCCVHNAVAGTVSAAGSGIGQ